MKGLCTSTIGSFPLDDSERNRTRILDDLIDLGIDFPNYPQLEGMGKQFLVDINAGRTVPGIEPFEWALRYLKRKNLMDKVRLKACLTGPFTLASFVKNKTGSSGGTSLFNTALSDKDKVDGYVGILTETCKAYSQHASMIFVDEPILSFMFGRRGILYGYEEADFINIYRRLKKACGNVWVGTHVCGRVSPLLAKTQLNTDLDIISHEFYDLPMNFNQYDRTSLEKNEKTLSIGCLSTKKQKVESIEEIRALMNQSIKKYDKNIIFTPDCGFGNLIVDGSRETGYKIAILKLHNMVEALPF